MSHGPLASGKHNPQVAWLTVVLFLFMLVMALVPAIKVTAGLPWGSVIDFHRDESFVRALLEGHYGEDPTYLGEFMWYPPLITWLESFLVVLTGLPVSTVIVQMGPYANLLAPTTFFIMAWYFFGPARAALITAAYLFFSVGQEPGYAVATYSARIIPVSFCQAFFYIGLILVHRAFQGVRPGRSLAAGFFAGITFLAHPAPALLLVLIIVACTVVAMSGSFRKKDRKALRDRAMASLIAGAAFLVATLPLTYYILGHYGLHTINRSGFLFTYYVLSLHESALFLHYNLSLFNLLGLAGLVFLAIRRQDGDLSPDARRIVLLWMLFSTGLFLYSYFISVLDHKYGIALPGTVPSFHYFFYLKGALAVLAGLLVWHLFAWTWKRVRRMDDAASLAGRTKPVLVLFALVALACSLAYPSYATRRDLWVNHNRDKAFLDDHDSLEMAERASQLLPWDAVVLCDEMLGSWPMLPTARHVVITASTFGNPYVDQHERATDGHRMLLGMQQPLNDTDGLVAKYGVTNLLITRDDLARMPLAKQWFPKELHGNARYVLLGR